MTKIPNSTPQEAEAQSNMEIVENLIDDRHECPHPPFDYSNSESGTGHHNAVGSDYYEEWWFSPSCFKEKIKEVLDTKDTFHAKQVKGRDSAWQKMCEKFVGVSMLADEFAGEPHDPECFGNYVQNLLDQIATLEAQVEGLRNTMLDIANDREFSHDVNGKFVREVWYKKHAKEALTNLDLKKKEIG